MRKFFITGTDTGVGKTHIACGLLKIFQQYGLSTIGLKPIASGCEKTLRGLRNQDALCLQQTATIKLPYENINPIALEPAIAPHIAAQQIKQILSAASLITACEPVLNYPADICVIEGAGGWYTPLNKHETMADFVVALNTPVVLVVGVRLGCLNHALLTQQAIINCSVKLHGWVANCLEKNMEGIEENIELLKTRLSAPLLGMVPYNKDADKYLSLDG